MEGHRWYPTISRYVPFIAAAFHMVVAQLLGSMCTSVLHRNLEWAIHIVLFCFMSRILKFIRASWTLMTRDEPLERWLVEEVMDILADAVSIALYVFGVLFFSYPVTVLHALWWILVSLFCFCIGRVALISIYEFFFFRLDARREDHRHRSAPIFSIRFFLTGIEQVGSAVYYCGAMAFQLLGVLRAHFLEISRSRPEKYRQKAPNSAYQYEPLHNPSQEIRLVKLTKSPFSGVGCTLERFSLHKAPTYEAISYTWGSSDVDHLVFFNGHWLPTTRNVYKIFQDRASYFRTRWVWIDAVCINQDDNVEKSIQVRMMGEIYHSAERVIIWLGDITVTFAEVICASFLLKKLECEVRNHEYHKGRMDDMDLPIGSSTQWGALNHLMSHSYWQRIWIIQEIVKARKVHVLYGGWYMSWDILSTGVHQLLSVIGVTIIVREATISKIGLGGFQAGIKQVNHISDIRMAFAVSSQNLLSLEVALKLTSNCLATDPRDKIFALDNLIQMDGIEENMDLRPNYSLSVQEIYTRTTRYLLSRRSSFGLFRSGIGNRRNIPNLPSWVLDWTAIGFHTLDDESTLTGGYRSSGNSVLYSSVKISSIAENLAEMSLAHVLPLSKIKHLSAITLIVEGLSSLPEASNFLLAFYQDAHSMVFENLPMTYNLTKQSLKEAFWRTVVGDRNRNNDQSQLWRPAEGISDQAFLTWDKYFLGKTEDENEDEEISEQDINEAREIGMILEAACNDKRLAVTEDGMMAVVPQFTEIGDLVCLVGGVHMPLLLRGEDSERREEGDKEGARWRMVGQCYVHGIMDGELWNDGKGAREFRIY